MPWVFLFLFAIFSCAPPNSGKTTVSFERIQISFFPEQIPSSLPRAFLPKEATFLRSVDLRSGFLNGKEAFLLVETKESLETLVKGLEERSKFGDWKLLEKNQEKEGIHLLYEGFLKKYISIRILPQKDTCLVKYYFKKNSTY